jgi:hypothetical protein
MTRTFEMGPVTEVRVERLQDISGDDARAEGVSGLTEFRALWFEIHGRKHPWESNPWLWAISFRRVEL